MGLLILYGIVGVFVFMLLYGLHENDIDPFYHKFGLSLLSGLFWPIVAIMTICYLLDD